MGPRCLLVDTAECVSGTPAVLHRGPPRCGTLMFGAAPGAAYRCSTLVLLDFTVVHPCAMSYLKMYHMPPQKSQNELWYQWFCIGLRLGAHQCSVFSSREHRVQHKCAANLCKLHIFFNVKIEIKKCSTLVPSRL